MRKKVAVLSTRTCHYRPVLEQALLRLQVPFQSFYIDERPDLVQKWHIQCSPVLFVDEKPVFIGMPDIQALERFFLAQ